jgi:hypothetical protein
MAAQFAREAAPRRTERRPFHEQPRSRSASTSSEKAAMTHIAVQEKRDGKTVDWLEKVSDAQYRK